MAHGADRIRRHQGTPPTLPDKQRDNERREVQRARQAMSRQRTDKENG